jgi:probable F420-dependent oxidoreductase
MKIGVFATFMSPLATPDLIADFGRKAEAIGVESIWMGEHVVLFDQMEFPYPGSADGRIPVPENGGLLDTVATIGFLAGATARIRFGSGVALISQRNPIYTAKEFATLDWLTGGRIDFGVGVGWCKEEVIACGYSWEDRGKRSDEFLELVGRLWRDPVTTFVGEHFDVQQARLDPKPVQADGLPIIVGGYSPAAFRRASRFGRGWYGFGLDPRGTAALLQRLDRALEAAGRSREDFEVLITPSDDSPDAVREFRELGVDRLIVPLGSQRPAKLARRLERLESLIASVAD